MITCPNCKRELSDSDVACACGCIEHKAMHEALRNIFLESGASREEQTAFLKSMLKRHEALESELATLKEQLRRLKGGFGGGEIK